VKEEDIKLRQRAKLARSFKARSTSHGCFDRTCSVNAVTSGVQQAGSGKSRTTAINTSEMSAIRDGKRFIS
jgi:hypothetical protein